MQLEPIGESVPTLSVQMFGLHRPWTHCPEAGPGERTPRRTVKKHGAPTDWAHSALPDVAVARARQKRPVLPSD